MKYRKVGESSSVDMALVLGGGGAKGVYQVGVIKEMLLRGMRPDLVTGSSIGAFNGALLTEFINQGLSNKEIASRLEEVWEKIEGILTLNWPGFLLNFFNPLKIPSIYTNIYVKKMLAQYIPADRQFSHYTICQLSVTGTNLDKKENKIFDFNSKICVRRAVLASMTYPVAFPTVQIEGDQYIDGGAMDNAPLKEAILWGAKDIIVVFLSPLRLITTGQVKRKEDISYSALKVIEELIELATNKLMYGDLKKAEKINELLRLLNKYIRVLPPGFVKEISRLFGLKHEGGKRIINIIRIAPDKALNPPGTMGFNRKKDLIKLLEMGNKDARAVLSTIV